MKTVRNYLILVLFIFTIFYPQYIVNAEGASIGVSPSILTPKIMKKDTIKQGETIEIPIKERVEKSTLFKLYFR